MRINPSPIVMLSLVAITAGCASESKPTPAADMKGLSKSDPVYGYVEAMRTDLSRGKVEILTHAMQLNAEESKVFWPIYRKYEAELFDLGDKRLELIKQFFSNRQGLKLDNQKATDLSNGYFQLEAANLELVKKYHGIIAKEVSPVRAAQFTQIEHRVRTVLDLLVAAELPLVDGK